MRAPNDYTRVSGSAIGGGTYWGLCRLLTKCTSYENAIDLSETGDASEIDMLVGDIYGKSYDKLNMKSAMVASSFGKLVMKENPNDAKDEDIALALLMMITNNIGQVAYLNAKLHGCSKIFFVGSFLRTNNISCKRLAFAIDFWSKGSMEAYFLEHEGYFGALVKHLFSESLSSRPSYLCLYLYLPLLFLSSPSEKNVHTQVIMLFIPRQEMYFYLHVTWYQYF